MHGILYILRVNDFFAKNDILLVKSSEEKSVTMSQIHPASVFMRVIRYFSRGWGRSPTGHKGNTQWTTPFESMKYSNIRKQQDT